MNPEVKAKWIAALRSGEYKQGFYQLRQSDGRSCCLGVLCDLHAKETKGEWMDGYYLGEWSRLPAPVIIWAGLEYDQYGKLPDGTSLFQHNDGQHGRIMRKPFRDIADIIESQL